MTLIFCHASNRDVFHFVQYKMLVQVWQLQSRDQFQLQAQAMRVLFRSPHSLALEQHQGQIQDQALELLEPACQAWQILALKCKSK